MREQICPAINRACKALLHPSAGANRIHGRAGTCRLFQGILSVRAVRDVYQAGVYCCVSKSRVRLSVQLSMRVSGFL